MFQIIERWRNSSGALIEERVRAGLRNARAKGIRLGRPRSSWAICTRKASQDRSSVATLTALPASMQMPILQSSCSMLMRRMERQKSRLFAGKSRAES